MKIKFNHEEEYWNKRFRDLEESKHKTVEEFADEIKRQFTRGIQYIRKELADFYERFARNEGISYLDAQRILTKPEKEELKMDIWEYIRLGRLNASEYNERTAKLLERASTAYRVTRLEALELKLSSIAAAVFNPVGEKIYEALYKIYDDVYNRTVFEVFKGLGRIKADFVGVTPQNIANVLRKPWHAGVTFSEKVWLNQNKLIQALTDELSTGILNGASYQDLAKNLAKKMDSTYNDAYRLISTEAAFFYGEAQKDAMEELGCKKYQFRSELNSRVCEKCGDLDGQVFKYKDRKPGLNAVPMHPHCRCVERPYIEDMIEEDDTRSGKNTEGKSVLFPASMTYKEWYEQVGKTLDENEAAKEKKKRKKGKKKDDPKKPKIRIQEVNTLG